MEEEKTMDPEATGVDDGATSVRDSEEILKSDEAGMDKVETAAELNDGKASDSHTGNTTDRILHDENFGKGADEEKSQPANESVNGAELESGDPPKTLEAESTECLTEPGEEARTEISDEKSHDETAPQEIGDEKSHDEIAPQEVGNEKSHDKIAPQEVGNEKSHDEITPQEIGNEKSHDEIAPQGVVLEKVEVPNDQKTNQQQECSVSETATTQQQTNYTSEEFSEFSSEQVVTQTVKQTIATASQESTISRSMDSLTTETNFKINGNENLLDPDKVSELRRSPYYDSLIANRISMESEGMLPKTVQKEGQNATGENYVLVEDQPDVEQNDAENVSLSNGDKAEEQATASSTSQSDFSSKGISSLKEACQEAVNASQQVNHKVTRRSVMFKVTKFEAKPFSEVKSSSEWTYDKSSLLKSEESFMSSHQTSDLSSSSEMQEQSIEDMGVPPANEDVPFRFSPNAYKPPPEDDMDFMDLPRKKKMFSSSSFYEEPNAIYPTVEEQVELCRKIADSLSDDSNKKSKGANMFFKRVKRAEKWVTESIGTGYDGDYYESSRSESVTTPDPSKAPYVRVSQGPPQLKLILDPRHLLDMKRLRQEGVNIVEHNAVSPEICLDLVKDLNSPTGRGAQLFAKRKKKSAEWVVDEERLKQLLRERESGYTSSPEPPATIPYGAGVEPMIFPRVQMLKTPWAAAMESPIGSCAGAFKDVHPNEVAESVIRAAETKIMTYPTPVRPVIEPVIKPESNVQLKNYPSSTVFTPAAAAFTPAPAPQQPSKLSTSTSSFKAGVYAADPYKPRAPRGWTGAYSGGSQFFSTQPPSLPAFQASHQVPQAQAQLQENPVQEQMPSVPSYKLSHQTSVMRTYSFTDFNKSPRAWNESASAYSNVYIKPVKPPSVLVQ